MLPPSKFCKLWFSDIRNTATALYIRISQLTFDEVRWLRITTTLEVRLATTLGWFVRGFVGRLITTLATLATLFTALVTALVTTLTALTLFITRLITALSRLTIITRLTANWWLLIIRWLRLIGRLITLSLLLQTLIQLDCNLSDTLSVGG
jgi:hypothetical protein